MYLNAVGPSTYDTYATVKSRFTTRWFPLLRPRPNNATGVLLGGNCVAILMGGLVEGVYNRTTRVSGPRGLVVDFTARTSVLGPPIGPPMYTRSFVRMSQCPADKMVSGAISTPPQNGCGLFGFVKKQNQG